MISGLFNAPDINLGLLHATGYVGGRANVGANIAISISNCSDDHNLY